MNIIEKSESIRDGLQKGFRDGTSKMALRKCYGYDVGADGELVVNSDEAAIVRWIFESYLNGNSLGKIAAGLEKRGILSPTGKPKWNREALNKLISNEKYTGRVLLQKTVSTGGSQIKNNGFMDRCLYSDTHEAIISDEIFKSVQQEKARRTGCPEAIPAIQLIF
ncbi:MAG: recombinase family protein [Oscillospiraceae bacterium]|nr:recombinase family protein [Oscillospiraceae bacterium]